MYNDSITTFTENVIAGYSTGGNKLVPFTSFTT